MTPVIEIDQVELRYNDVQALRGLTLAASKGEILALLGPSGSGKTSVLRLILGFVAPGAGVVRLEGKPVSREGRVLIPPEERNLAVVFQDLALWPHLTVRGNLAFGLESRKVPAHERDRRIADMLQRVGLGAKEPCYPSDLSGGEKQRVAIARALVLEPRAVLLDEPLSNLDVGLKRELLEMFRELLKERGTTAVYVTHDPREAASLGDRIAILAGGGLVQEGSLAVLCARPANDFVRSLIDDLRWSGTPRGLPPGGAC